MIISEIVSGLAKPMFGLIDDLFTSDEERDKAKLKFLKMEQDGKLAQTAQDLSIILSDSKSKDPWTSRSRPSFNYVMYFLILCSVPMGILSAFHPETAAQIAQGMKMWLGAIPEPLWDAFWICFTGYTIGRTVEKTKGVAK